LYNIVVKLGWYVKAWDEWICMSKMAYGLWMMSLACDEYGMVGYKCDMELVWAIMWYWLMEHDIGMVRT